MTQCPVCGMMVDEQTAPRAEYKGKTYHFMNPIHREMFLKDPETFIKRAASRRGMHGMSNMNNAQ